MHVLPWALNEKKGVVKKGTQAGMQTLTSLSHFSAQALPTTSLLPFLKIPGMMFVAA